MEALVNGEAKNTSRARLRDLPDANQSPASRNVGDGPQPPATYHVIKFGTHPGDVEAEKRETNPHSLLIHLRQSQGRRPFCQFPEICPSPLSNHSIMNHASSSQSPPSSSNRQPRRLRRPSPLLLSLWGPKLDPRFLPQPIAEKRNYLF